MFSRFLNGWLGAWLLSHDDHLVHVEHECKDASVSLMMKLS